MDARNPEGLLRVVLPRERNVKYWLERYNNSYFLRIQDQNRLNSEMAIASVNSPEEQTVRALFWTMLHCLVVRF